ncbi:MAG: hypothetical protein IKJ68_13275 [Clostridia bacterium]|nr:hypothetical protein [Clostridia bacterium]
MKIHCSDRGKRKAEVWECACLLFRLQQIDLSRFERGNIIVKKSFQKRILSDGSIKVYEYHYENIDIFGKGQIHLPVKGKKRHNPSDLRWRIRDGIRYRNDIEFRIKNATIKLDNAIQELNSYKKSTEVLETIETVMASVRRAMGNKEKYRKIQKEREERRYRNNGFSEYEIDGLIVTDLGEEVRSKNECLFANKLREMNIPYLYEMSLGGTVVPDFALFIDKEVYFVELLGMMEKDSYKAAQDEKIKKYESMNIFLGGQLIFIDVTMGFSTPIITKILQQIIEKGAPDKIVAGYNRTKHDEILAKKEAMTSWNEDDGDQY